MLTPTYSFIMQEQVQDGWSGLGSLKPADVGEDGDGEWPLGGAPAPGMRAVVLA